MSDVVVSVENVSKKFCRSLKQGILYTSTDVARDMLGLRGHNEELRPNEFWSVNDVSLELKRGECLGLIGHNGAGKSTLLKMLNGIIRPDKGRINMKGRVGGLIEVGAGFHPLLSGRENIYVNGAILGMGKGEIDEKFDDIVSFSGLNTSVLDAPVKSYSSGMFVRLGFAVAINCQPDILLIDEVLAVGDMNFQSRCLNALGALRRQGTTVILVSHNLNHIAGWASRALAFEMGHVLAEGDPMQVIQGYADAMAIRNQAKDTNSVQPNGSGRASIENVRIIDTNGREITDVKTGQALSIMVEVNAIEPLCGVELDLKVFDGENQLISGASSRYTNGNLQVPAGASTIIAQYPPMPLNGGHIRPSIALWKDNRSELLDWRECLATPVIGVAASEGKLWWCPHYTVNTKTTHNSVA